MSKETMSLKMQIIATGAQALSEIAKVQKGVRAAGHDLSALGGYASGGFNFLLKPLKIGAGLAAGMAAALAALGGKAISAAAADEKLVSRLTAVYGSADKARKVFKELEGISRISPFNPEELTDAMFVLNSFGMGTKKNLGIVAATARAADMSISDLAQGISALQMRGLKKFGIELTSNGDQDVIKYRDKMQKIHTITTKTSDETRKSLMRIMEIKFGSSFETSTFSGLKKVFGNLIDQSFANVGDAMLPAAKSFFVAMNKELRTFIEGGTAEEWGKRAGKWLTDAVDKIVAAWQTMRTIAGQIKENWDKGGSGVGEIIKTAIVGGISFMLTSMFRVLGASVDIWVGIGKVLGAALMEQILQIPGLGLMRDKMANSNISAMSPAEREKVARKYGTYDSSKASISVYSDTHPAVARALAVGDQAANLTNAIKGMMQIGPELMSGMQADLAAYRAKIDSALGISGISKMTPTYEANLAGRKSARYAQENPEVAEYLAQLLKIRSGALPGAQSLYFAQKAQREYNPEDNYNTRTGPQNSLTGLPRGMTFNIDRLIVQANNAQELVSALVYSARSPVLAAAGV